MIWNKGCSCPPIKKQYPTRLQRVDNSYQTGLALTKTIPSRRKDMIARHIKASFLQTYSDPKNNDPVQIGVTQDNAPLKGPQHSNHSKDIEELNETKLQQNCGLRKKGESPSMCKTIKK